jgi:hypothetical protein
MSKNLIIFIPHRNLMVQFTMCIIKPVKVTQSAVATLVDTFFSVRGLKKVLFKI